MGARRGGLGDHRCTGATSEWCFVNRDNLTLWEVLDPNEPALTSAGELYEATQSPAERIPWDWLASAPARRATWRAGQWSPHLILAAPREDDNLLPPVGFIYGAVVPGFGGYVCYLGVDPKARKSGLGGRLFDAMFRALEDDAASQGVELPFILWESRRPGDDAPASARDLWAARVRLFSRVGSAWMDGVTFHSPNYLKGGSGAVPLQLFLTPRDAPADSFDGDRLRTIVAGLHSQVYGNGPGDPHYRATMAGCGKPRLRPAAEADRIPLVI